MFTFYLFLFLFQDLFYLYSTNFVFILTFLILFYKTHIFKKNFFFSKLLLCAFYRINKKNVCNPKPPCLAFFIRNLSKLLFFCYFIEKYIFINKFLKLNYIGSLSLSLSFSTQQNRLAINR